MSDDRPSKARDELNGMVIGAELTLISIIQGTALYFLVKGTCSSPCCRRRACWAISSTPLASINGSNP